MFGKGWGWQVACGDGWRDLLLKLKHDLEMTRVPYEICQIKEKFGGLRFYVDITGDATEKSRDEFNALIEKAESDSVTICEGCGNPGERGGEGWITTACKSCREQKK
jgi:hypothetical protein